MQSSNYVETLLWGAKKGQLNLVQESWMQVDNRNATDLMGHNALTLSIINGQVEVFHFLLDAGVNLDLVNGVLRTLSNNTKLRHLKDNYGNYSILGETALICAVMKRDSLMVQYLINKGASVNYVDTEGNTALYYAVLQRCDSSIIESLMESGSNIDQTLAKLNEYANQHESFSSYWNDIKSQHQI